MRGITKYNTAIFDTNTATRKLSLEAARDEIRQGETDAEKAYDLMGALSRRPEYSLVVDASRKFVLKKPSPRMPQLFALSILPVQWPR